MALYLHNEIPTSVMAQCSKSTDGLSAIDNSFCILNYNNKKTITLENSRISPDGYD